MAYRDRPLGAPALDAVNVALTWEYPHGWRVKATWRASGDVAFDSEGQDELTAEEAVDYACCVLGDLLC